MNGLALLPALAVLLLPALLALWVKRPARDLPVMVALPSPPPEPLPWGPTARTAEQRAVDQARFDRALPRVGGAV